jgi:hypothetical protein
MFTATGLPQHDRPTPSSTVEKTRARASIVSEAGFGPTHAADICSRSESLDRSWEAVRLPYLRVDHIRKSMDCNRAVSGVYLLTQTLSTPSTFLSVPATHSADSGPGTFAPADRCQKRSQPEPTKASKITRDDTRVRERAISTWRARPNESRLSCVALKEDSSHNLRAPPASSAC